MSQHNFNNFVSSFVNHDEYEMNKNNLIFHLSKKLEIDEITKDDFLFLDLMEFCEALFRVIDIYSPPPPDDNLEDWTIERRKEQLLIDKIDNIMPTLYKKINHPQFNTIRDKFIIPLKDQITSLYVIDIINNPYYNGYESYLNLKK